MIQPCLWPWIELFFSGGQEPWHLCVIQQQPFNPMDYSSPGSSVHGDSPGKNTGVGSHSLFQESSQCRDQNQVSHIAGRFFTIWATKETQQQIIRNKSWENNPTYHQVIKNKIPRNKSNQGAKTPVPWKFQDTDKRHWRLNNQKDIWCSWTGSLMF